MILFFLRLPASLILLNNMDFEIVEVYMFNKAVLCETGLAEFFKVIYVDIKPCRYLKVEGMTGLIQCGKTFFVRFISGLSLQTTISRIR